MTTVDADAVIGFRLRSHHLLEREPFDTLLAVTGACAVQNSPPGSALLALAARVDGVTGARIDELVGQGKSLLQTWCLRGAPFFFPTADAATFTTGVVPPTEASRSHLVRGVEQALLTLDMGLDEIVDHTASVIRPVLSGRELAIGELGEQLADRVAGGLTTAQRRAWAAPGPYGSNQPLGQAVAHFCLRILTLRGIVCMAPRREGTAPFVLVEDWLGAPLPVTDPEVARADLLRRFLRCYGPSNRRDFAAWLGVAAGDVDPWWNTLGDELIPVDFAGRCAWIHVDDLDELRSPPTARAVRLLPPGDPFTQARDRDTLVDRLHRRSVWPAAGAPGTVLADGVIAGVWRPRKNRKNLTITVTSFRRMSRRVREELRVEARLVAELRGATDVRVDYD
ncbi:winged helix DNA-binding domain-containing protein [Nocardia sp. NPDC003979]